VAYEERDRFENPSRYEGNERMPDDRRREDPRYDDRRYEGQPRRRRGGFLENIFGNFGEGGMQDD
jgi:hypothetical protein